MWVTIIEYLTVIAGSMFKFILGPVLSVAYGLSALECFILTAGGMMCTIFLFCSKYGQVAQKAIGHFFVVIFRKIFRREPKKKKVFTPRSRKMVSLWKRFGLPGVAFLTPLLLSPVGGAILVNAFGGRNRAKIYLYMLISSVAWSVFYTALFYIWGYKR